MYRAQQYFLSRTLFIHYAIILVLTRYCSAFCSLEPVLRPSRWISNRSKSLTLLNTIAWTPRPSKTSPRLSMAVGKTGGKLIETVEEYTSIVLEMESQKPVMVFFTAPWCGPCRLSIPVVKDVMKQFAGQIEVVEVCTDDLPEVASDAGVVSIPTIQMYAKDELLDTIVGCVAKSVLAASVEKVLEETLSRYGASDSAVEQ
uniref:Thioredoxin domain-containing protein n=1 Tax=Phaeodactylum tricornutum TaxID=2850 RepID=A0A8J9S1D1_PHATR